MKKYPKRAIKIFRDTDLFKNLSYHRAIFHSRPLKVSSNKIHIVAQI